MGYCGIDCKTCRNFQDYRLVKDRKERVQVCYALGFSADTEDIIECFGCEYDENVNPQTDCLDFCLKCEKRACAIEKKVSSCLECKEYKCRKYPIDKYKELK